MLLIEPYRDQLGDDSNGTKTTANKHPAKGTQKRCGDDRLQPLPRYESLIQIRHDSPVTLAEKTSHERACKCARSHQGHGAGD